MPLFRRIDADLVQAESSMRRMMPFLMRGRNESLVFHCAGALEMMRASLAGTQELRAPGSEGRANRRGMLLAPSVQSRSVRKETAMPKSSANVATLADLITAACYAAETVTSDRSLALELATRTVARRLARTGRNDLARRLSGAARPVPVRSSIFHRQAA